MKIIKYTEFIKEELVDTPETFISTKFLQLKKKIDKYFVYNKEETDILSPEELKKKTDKGMTFGDLGLTLDSSDISKYSKVYDSLTVKFSDDENTYTLIIMIDIKDAIPEDEENEGNFDIDDIKDGYIKFKKYDMDNFDLQGQLSKNVKIKDIDEDFLINLKLEIDEKFGDEDEDFKIETEE